MFILPTLVISEVAVPATRAISRYETSGETFMDLNLKI
jgi:hypothetical protein